ncbi:MAG: hypothetical protein A3A97_03255 [Candidatus Terrybacteria bacterium RIFCSPLOWO2_01_FULL_40_23]|uniref:Transglycosylase SLT domain-containing protein n=1 Tax=Candidatus Terrybacteria bacterium RIFCSPLOWO2_01_FULL_40_23 TaxID=1802366 RepID=A0A1G2PSH4_9BACT|nr:MAG: hypothetical protein A3A97_03255 [Candidatus Terrybacteria bacterium RIFCSPLOWO2_01_FULL_40_23]
MNKFLSILGFNKKTPRIVLRGVLLVLFSLILIAPVYSMSINEMKQEIDNSLRGIEQEIAALVADIDGLKNQQRTLAREVRLFDAELRKVELEIKRIKIEIDKNQQAIGEKEKEIAVYEKKLQESRNALAETILTVDQNDKESILEIILTAENFSDVFGKITNIESVEKAVHERIAEVKDIKSVLDKEKEVLEGQKEELIGLQTLAAIQQAGLEEKKQAKVDLLAQTKGREKLFSEQLVKAKQDAAVLRQQIFLLEGSGVSMPFEDALTLAKKASSYANIRPAFLLAVLKKESHWGASVGTGNWRDDMHPRDQAAFFEICYELGLDPDSTPVSRKPSYGWGGAMGPAQFLPRTWLGWKDRVAEATGHNPPSPWNLEDAFTASALKLGAGGATQSADLSAEALAKAEWKAAMIYFAGSNWDNPIYSFYADDIMVLTGLIQEQINLIEDSPVQ